MSSWWHTGAIPIAKALHASLGIKATAWVMGSAIIDIDGRMTGGRGRGDDGLVRHDWP